MGQGCWWSRYLFWWHRNIFLHLFCHLVKNKCGIESPAFVCSCHLLRKNSYFFLSLCVEYKLSYNLRNVKLRTKTRCLGGNFARQKGNGIKGNSQPNFTQLFFLSFIDLHFAITAQYWVYFTGKDLGRWKAVTNRVCPARDRDCPFEWSGQSSCC